MSRRAIKNESRDKLLAVLDQLPERDRQIIQKCFYEGQDQKEAAEELGMSYDALRKALQRAREQVSVIARRLGLVKEE